MMKRVLAILTAVLLLCTGCSSVPKQQDSIPSLDSLTSTETVKGATMEVSYSHAWSSRMLDTLDAKSFLTLHPAGDALLISGMDDNDYRQPAYALYSSENGTESADLRFRCLKYRAEGVFITIEAVLQEENGYTVVYAKSEADENDQPGQKTHYAETYDKDWNYSGETELTDISPDYALDAVAATPDGYCTLEHTWNASELRFYDKSWAKTGKLPGSLDTNAQLISAADGTLYLCTPDGLQQIDAASQSATDAENAGLSEISGGCAGCGDVRYCLWNTEGVWGVLQNGDAEQLVDWTASDFDGHCVSDVYMLTEDSFAVSMYGTNEGVWLLTPRTDADNQTVITLAAVSIGSEMTDAVNAYNRQSDCVHIQMKEMDADALKTALISGDVPDILCTGHIPYESFVKKGLFEDLSQYMASDADFHKEDYLPNFFETLQYDGGLYSLSYAYTVYTVAGKTQTVGDKEGLSLAEYMTLAQSLPEGMDFTFHPTNWSVFGEYCLGTMCSFVDVPNAACHFDSPEMVQFLEFCGAFPSDRTVYPEDDDPSELFHADKIAVQSEHLFQAGDYHRLLAEEYGGEPVTFIGRPIANGTGNGASFGDVGGLALYSQSQHKAEVWEFFKFLLSEEYQNSLTSCFPAHLGALQKQMDDAALTTEESADLLGYLERIQDTTYYDETVQTIVQEEAEMYFTGDQSALQAVKQMQSRVEIYLAEQG